MYKNTCLFLAAIIIGCGSSAESKVTLNEVSPCALKDSIYKVHMIELNGNCGTQQDSYVNTSQAQGLIQSHKITCDSSESNKCVVNNRNCSYNENGCEFNYDSTLTFTNGGQSASGQISMTVMCPGVFSCSSIYRVVYTHQ
jgi:hypothetical protein